MSTCVLFPHRRTLEFLLKGGNIFTTVDEQHFKSMESGWGLLGHVCPIPIGLAFVSSFVNSCWMRWHCGDRTLGIYLFMYFICQPSCTGFYFSCSLFAFYLFIFCSDVSKSWLVTPCKKPCNEYMNNSSQSPLVFVLYSSTVVTCLWTDYNPHAASVSLRSVRLVFPEFPEPARGRAKMAADTSTNTPPFECPTW